jgi:hypothetical protein
VKTKKCHKKYAHGIINKYCSRPYGHVGICR